MISIINAFQRLVYATIIETGIDIPMCPTLHYRERADHFGLAQLHQRGRVGRSHHQAYAWLLTPHPKAMTRCTKRRQAVAPLEDLRAGFALATHDPRFARGELLGEEQTAQWKPSVSRCIWSCWKTPSMH